MGFVIQNTVKKMSPNFHRQIKDVSIATHLLSVVNYKMLIKFPSSSVHAHLPHDFAAPSLESGPGQATCSGLWNTGKYDVSKNLKNTCALGHTLLLVSGILRMPCKEAGLAYQRIRTHVGQRWAVPGGPSQDRWGLLTARNQSEAILDHPTSDRQTQTRRPSWHTKRWEIRNVYLNYFFLNYYILRWFVLLQKLTDIVSLILYTNWLHQWKDRTNPDGLKWTVYCIPNVNQMFINW